MRLKKNSKAESVLLLAVLFIFTIITDVQAQAWSPKDYTAFIFTPIDGEYAVQVNTYSTWLGKDDPNNIWPIATDDESDDGMWKAEVRVYAANGDSLGTIDVPKSAKGKVDYSHYVDKGISYLVVTQGSGARSEEYYVKIKETAVSAPEQTEKSDVTTTPAEGETQKSNTSATPKTAKEQESNDAPGSGTDDTPPVMDTVHIIFTKIEGEDYKVRAQCDNGQYGETWWGIWDISSEGSWASKIYVLDADKKMLGKLSVPESALGVLDYSEYKDKAAYIQVEHSMCVGIYEISTDTTIKGTLDDIIAEEDDTLETVGAEEDAAASKLEDDRAIILSFVVAAIIILITILFIHRRRNRND